MKRTLWIFAMIPVTIIGIIISLYLFRKDKALDQYIYPNTQAVVSVALDDLLLDNMTNFFKHHKDSTVSMSGLLDIRNWWGAGIYIPAQIYFFSLKENPLRFFTIQKIENPKKWDAFLKEHGIDPILSREHAGERVYFAHLSRGVNVLYNDQYLLFHLALPKEENDKEIQTIWNEMNDWVSVRDLHLPLSENSDAHVAYVHTDGTFQLFADVSDGDIALSGHWELQTDAPKISKKRNRETNASFISFWSNLPHTETSFIMRCLSVFSDTNPDILVNNTYDYVDLFVSSDTTIQQDTMIVYDYDEDFNSIERKEIQEIGVPIIENTWKGSMSLVPALPEKLFYRFYKHVADSVVVLSTKKNIEPPPLLFVTTPSPFQIMINFHKLPSSWSNMLLPLQEKAVQIAVETSIINKNTLAISGRIRYRDK